MKKINIRNKKLLFFSDFALDHYQMTNTKGGCCTPPFPPDPPPKKANGGG